MLSKKVKKALNGQVQVEAMASHSYLAMACWARQQALDGTADFFFEQALEERVHMMKVIDYLHEVEGPVVVPALKQPSMKFKNVLELFESAFANERVVTQSIHDLVALCDAENDIATSNFLDWFIEEQREEEALFKRIIKRIKLIGMEGQGLYEIDKMMEALEKPVE